MNLAYFKERFNNTESAYLLARRANNSDLNPYARQAIEEIITERGERVPDRSLKADRQSLSLKETISEGFRRFARPMVNVLGVKAVGFEFNKRTFSLIPIGAMVIAIVLGYYVIFPKTSAEVDGSSNWYLYGLIPTSYMDSYQKKLVPYKINVISGSCIIGGDDYEKGVKNNQRVYESASDELKLLLGKPRSHIN